LPLAINTVFLLIGSYTLGWSPLSSVSLYYYR